jgi:putative lipoprotein
MRFQTLFVTMLAACALLAVGCGGESKETGKLTGTVKYLQQMEMPKGAELRVALQDISRADAPAQQISELTIPVGEKSGPCPFSLPYDPEKIDPHRTYSVRAEIWVDGERRFISNQSYPVITHDAGMSADVIVMALKMEQADDSPLVATYWKLIELDGKGIMREDQRRDPHITFLAENHRVAATGGCNMMTGGYVAKDDSLTFTPFAATKMMCPGIMEQEDALIAVLGKTVTYAISGGVLEFYDGNGNVVAKLLAAQDEE